MDLEAQVGERGAQRHDHLLEMANEVGALSSASAVALDATSGE